MPTVQEHLLRALIILLDVASEQRIPTETISQKWMTLEKRILSLPYSANQLRVVLSDARKLPLPSASIDFVVTSPPYINVFNYHHNFRGSVEALSWAPLRVAQSEIGSNRKFRGNRFLTVVQYVLDMALALTELKRVCRSDARLIFVVGRESFVQKTPFFNGEIVAQIAHLCSFRAALRQQRVFRNKFGSSIFEDILHLTPDTGAELSPANLRSAAREFAKHVLEDALARVPAETEAALIQALERVHSVESSPVFHAASAISKTKESNAASDSTS